MSNSKLAAPELAAIDVTGMTRQSFIVRGALTAGAVAGTAAVGPFVSRALAQEGGGDVAILNFALTLEYLEAGFYAEAQQKVKLGTDAKDLAKVIGEHEDEHVTALIATIKDLGGTPAKEPKGKFDLADEAGFLQLAQTLEDTGVSAYNGAAPAIKSKELLAVAGQIVQVEARHAGAIRLQRGEAPSPMGFDATLEQQEVLDKVKPFIAS